MIDVAKCNSDAWRCSRPAARLGERACFGPQHTWAGRVTRAGYERLATAIRRVLGNAIAMGGTTLRDFVNSDGNPGYFQQSLYVYGRAGEPCRLCATPLKGIRTGQRASVFCPTCQAAGNFGGRDV